MNTVSLLLALLPMSVVPQAQPAATNDSSPAPTNVRGAEYPRVTPDLRVIFRIQAPDAQKVEFELGKHYPAQKDADGFWTATTDPQAPGFHYYFLWLDGVRVSDPASESFYGWGRQASGIEIPEQGVDYYLPKDVPHGDVRERWYHSTTTGAWRRVYVYTPPATTPTGRRTIRFCTSSTGPARTSKVAPRQETIANAAPSFHRTFPAHSLTVLRLRTSTR